MGKKNKKFPESLFFLETNNVILWQQQLCGLRSEVLQSDMINFKYYQEGIEIEIDTSKFRAAIKGRCFVKSANSDKCWLLDNLYVSKLQ